MPDRPLYRQRHLFEDLANFGACRLPGRQFGHRQKAVVEGGEDEDLEVLLLVGLVDDVFE